MEPTRKQIREQVRLALCRLVRDALELNDRQAEPKDVIIECEEDILEDAQLIMDYFRLKDLENENCKK